jgi:hypothetical protein
MTPFRVRNARYTVSLTVTDRAGNSTTTSGADVVLDLVRPTVSITTNAPVVNDTPQTLKAGDSVTVTFTFSEDPGNTLEWNPVSQTGDITVVGGRLSALSGSGLTRTATFTPTANSTAPASISIGNGAFTDAAGNANADANDDDNNNAVTLSVDTLVPTVSGVTITGKDRLDAAKVGSLTVGDQDHYRVTIGGGRKLTATVKPSALTAAGLAVLMPDGRQLVSMPGSAGASRSVVINNVGSAPVEVVLRVSLSSGSGGTYALSVRQ